MEKNQIKQTIVWIFWTNYILGFFLFWGFFLDMINWIYCGIILTYFQFFWKQIIFLKKSNKKSVKQTVFWIFLTNYILVFFENTSNINKLLARPKKKKEGRYRLPGSGRKQSCHYRYQNILREYYQQCYAHQIELLDKMDHFLRKHILPQRTKD